MNTLPIAKSVSTYSKYVNGFVGVRPRIYTYLVNDENNKNSFKATKEAIDVQKSVIKDFLINNNESADVWMNNRQMKRKMNTIQDNNYNTYYIKKLLMIKDRY